jgi:hypothetical protein
MKQQKFLTLLVLGFLLTSCTTKSNESTSSEKESSSNTTQEQTTSIETKKMTYTEFGQLMDQNAKVADLPTHIHGEVSSKNQTYGLTPHITLDYYSRNDGLKLEVANIETLETIGEKQVKNEENSFQARQIIKENDIVEDPSLA